MPYLFSPPVVFDVPSVVPTRHRGNALMRHYGAGPRGRTLLKIAGVYSLHDTPSAETVATASEVYVGGHIYEVSDAVGNALIAAGYETISMPLLTEDGFVLLTEDGLPLLTEGVSFNTTDSVTWAEITGTWAAHTEAWWEFA